MIFQIFNAGYQGLWRSIHIAGRFISFCASGYTDYVIGDGADEASVGRNAHSPTKR